SRRVITSPSTRSGSTPQVTSSSGLVGRVTVSSATASSGPNSSTRAPPPSPPDCSGAPVAGGPAAEPSLPLPVQPPMSAKLSAITTAAPRARLLANLISFSVDPGPGGYRPPANPQPSALRAPGARSPLQPFSPAAPRRPPRPRARNFGVVAVSRAREGAVLA